MAAGESLQRKGVLGCHEQEQDSPAGHTSIHRCRGRGTLRRMDWQYTQETSWWQTCTETVTKKKEQPLDQAEYGPMYESWRPWPHDTGWKACFWERVWMGISGISPYSRVEETNDWGSKSKKTWIICKNFPGFIEVSTKAFDRKLWKSHSDFDLFIVFNQIYTLPGTIDHNMTNSPGIFIIFEHTSLWQINRDLCYQTP